MTKIKMFFNKIGESIKKFFTKENLKKVYRKDTTQSILSSIISIIIGIIIGFIIMVIIAFINEDGSILDAISGVLVIISGPFSSKTTSSMLTNTGDMIFYAVPLIFTGLSVAVAYKTGLFNIGAPGQYVMGTIGCLLVALSIKTNTRFEGILVWMLALLTGTLFGALWGIIPGLLKAFFNINEVIICIMTNWISANLATWLFTHTKSLISQENTKGAYLAKNIANYTPKLGLDKIFKGSYIDCGIVIAIVVAIIIFIVLNKTTFGYELKACGSNKNASKYAGLNEKKNIILSMVIAGGLAGMAACLYYLNPGIEYKYASQYGSLPSYGFNGIASAFLANCHPIGVIFSSIFIRYLNLGGEFLTKYGFNRYVADIIVAVIIYLAGFTRIIREILKKSQKKKDEQKSQEKSETGIENSPVEEGKNE